MKNIILLITICFTISFAEEKLTTITILFFNDFHGRIFPEIVKEIDENVPVGGAAYISQLVNEERKKNSNGCLFVASGDMFHGTPYSNLLKGKSVVALMNYMKLDAMSIGNHEFDWGEETLAQLVSFSQFPYLSANIFNKDGKRPYYLKPYLIVERKGKKIALIGVITKESASIIHPDYIKNLIFKNPKEILPSMVKEVKEKGADLIVLLSHLGFEEDKRIAEEVEGIQVIIGAHSHTVLMRPYIVKNVIITQAGYHGIYLGVLELKINHSTNEIVDYSKDTILKIVYADTGNRMDKKVVNILDKYYPPFFHRRTFKGNRYK